jgi:hypothetical protein
MPVRRINTRSAKKTRAQYLPKHSPALSLDVDASCGSYRIDTVAVELYTDGRFLQREPFESLLKKLRRSVDHAGCNSLGAAQAELVRAPEYRRLTKRLFDDIRLISKLIERNKNADPSYIWLSITHQRRRRGWSLDRTAFLLKKLRDIQSPINEYLLDYRPDHHQGGNRDPLVNHFISEMLDVWRSYSAAPPEQAAAERAFEEMNLIDVPKMFRSEYRSFARLLAGAWQDLGFPLLDHRNRLRGPLEDWFADRVRKQFPADPVDLGKI